MANSGECLKLNVVKFVSLFHAYISKINPNETLFSECVMPQPDK